MRDYQKEFDQRVAFIRRLVEESNRRRAIQEAYNAAHGITPHTVARGDQSTLRLYTPDAEQDDLEDSVLMAAEEESLEDTIAALEKEMRTAAAHLDFEVAAVLRDKIKKLRGEK